MHLGRLASPPAWTRRPTPPLSGSDQPSRLPSRSLPLPRSTPVSCRRLPACALADHSMSDLPAPAPASSQKSDADLTPAQKRRKLAVASFLAASQATAARELAQKTALDAKLAMLSPSQLSLYTAGLYKLPADPPPTPAPAPAAPAGQPKHQQPSTSTSTLARPTPNITPASSSFAWADPAGLPGSSSQPIDLSSPPPASRPPANSPRASKLPSARTGFGPSATGNAALVEMDKRQAARKRARAKVQRGGFDTDSSEDNDGAEVKPCVSVLLPRARARLRARRLTTERRLNARPLQGDPRPHAACPPLTPAQARPRRSSSKGGCRRGPCRRALGRAGARARARRQRRCLALFHRLCRSVPFSLPCPPSQSRSRPLTRTLRAALARRNGKVGPPARAHRGAPQEVPRPDRRRRHGLDRHRRCVPYPLRFFSQPQLTLSRAGHPRPKSVQHRRVDRAFLCRDRARARGRLAPGRKVQRQEGRPPPVEGDQGVDH